MGFRKVKVVQTPIVDDLLGSGKPYNPPMFSFCGECRACREMTARLSHGGYDQARVERETQMVFELLRDLEASMKKTPA